MLDFQRKKDFSVFSSSTPRDNSFLYFDQSKNLYDFVLKHENQMRQMESEIIHLKSQLIDIENKTPLSQSQNNNVLSTDNNNTLLNLKEEIKNEIAKDLSNIIISHKNEIKEKFDSLKEEIEMIEDYKNNNHKILEINNSLQNLNQQLMLNNEEKSNLENNICNRIDKDKKEMDTLISNINKRIDNFDLDFDRLIQSLKVQFINNAKTINQLENSKVNINDYERQIDMINQNMEELNNRIDRLDSLDNLNQINKNKIVNNKNGNIYTTENENDENDIDIGLDKKLNVFKDELYNDLEKINLKILNELKNQADDIKILYQELNNINIYMKPIRGKTSRKQLNLEAITSPKFEEQKRTSIEHSNIMSRMETELAKKANLDQLNFALETQAKLNEAFSSATRISRFCWDSEGVLNDNKYIKWSIQNINTALDVFKWENNSDNIYILQNGVYKIVIGLIGLETKKNFGLVLNNDKNIIINNNNYLGISNDNDINGDRDNIKFMEKYIACEENTKIKVILYDSNDNSEEAFLEITKII